LDPVTEPTPASLPRTLGLVAATSIVIGGIIGSGIFISPAIVAREVGAPGLSLGVWVVGGLVAACGSLCFAELASAIPATGGTYVFLKRAYRAPVLAFLFGWSAFFVSFPGPIAAVATAFAEYASVFLGPIMPYGVWAKRIVAVTMILTLTAVNYVSTRSGGRVGVVATTLKAGALLGIVFVGLVLGGAQLDRLAPVAPPAASLSSVIPAFGTGLIAVLFAYNGWTYSSYVGGEVKNPERNLPLSILAGIGITIVLYVSVNLAFLTVMPFERLQATNRPAADLMEMVVGPPGAAVLALAVMVSTMGAANAVLLSCARSYFAMATDGLFFKTFDKVHPRWKTPSNAVLAQGLMASAFALSGSFEQIMTYYAFLDYFFFTLAVAAVMILRRTEPDLPRPYRVWGYPFTPLVFLVICAWYLGNTLLYRTSDSLVGILLTLTGLPFYFYWVRRRRTDPAVESKGRNHRPPTT
jgi:APA family basic amino acid/polyamine antiporter